MMSYEDWLEQRRLDPNNEEGHARQQTQKYLAGGGQGSKPA